MPDFTHLTPSQMQALYAQMQQRENAGLSPEEIEQKNRKREEKRKKNKEQIKETLMICEKGSYEWDGRTVRLPFTSEQAAEAAVLLPEEVAALPAGSAGGAPCAFSCENTDALSLARRKTLDPAYASSDGQCRLLLLNLASAVRPGGGVRDGRNGQEEDLCRSSTLLLSLESEAAKPYYACGSSRQSHLGTDAVIFSPNVAVLRDGSGELLSDPFTISVLSCAAPNIRFGLEGLTQEEYEGLLDRRIRRILRAAVHFGFSHVILGAFGCGAFHNDAALVSDDFYRALLGPDGRGIAAADFAVLCPPGKEYNFSQFARNFASSH